MFDPVTFTTLRQFRTGVYACFGARRDALFELLDAATVAGLVPSLAYLSLPAVHRRGGGGLVDAPGAGGTPTPAGRGGPARPPLGWKAPTPPPGATVLSRPDAPTTAARR